MPQRSLHFRGVLFCSLFICAFLFPLKATEETKDDGRELVLNQTIKREMPSGETHRYTFAGEAGKCVHLAVEQTGTDVVIEMFSPANEKLILIDRPNLLLGRENLTYRLPETGTYTLILIGARFLEKTGYTISMEKIHTPSGECTKRQEAENLVSLGELQRGKSQFESSIVNFNKSIEIWQQLGDEYETMVAFYGLGWSYDSTGFNEKAYLFFGKGLQLARRRNDEFMVGNFLRGLGYADLKLGANDAAIAEFDESIAILRKFQTGSSISSGLHGMGIAQFHNGQFAESIATLKESLRLRKERKDFPGEIRTSISLAKVYSRLGMGKESIILLKPLYEKIVQPQPQNSVELSEILSELGWAYLFNQELDNAEQSFQSSLKLWEERNSVSGQAIALTGLGRVYAEKSEWTKALASFEKALAMIETLRDGITDNYFKMTFLADNQSYYEIYVRTLLILHSIYPHKGYERRALEIFEKSKARGLLDSINQANGTSLQNLPSDYRQRKLSLQKQYVDLMESLSETRGDPNQVAETRIYREKLQNVIIEKRDFEAKHKESDPSVTPSAQIEPLQIEEIQRLLDEDTVILEYGTFNSNPTTQPGFLWAVTKDEVVGFSLPSKQDIQEKINEFYRSSATQKENPQLAKELSDMLLKPLAKSSTLTAKKRIIVVSNGILQLLPFAVLPSFISESRYLIEDFEIIHLPSISILEALRKRENSRSRFQKTALILADPVFSSNDERFSVPESSNSNKNISSPEKLKTNVFPRLFNSRFETETIKAALRPDEVDIKIDFAASVENFLKSDLENYRIIHLAGHALIDNQNPELSRIVLSLFDQNRRPIDGFLLSDDILNLRFNADLVVLSACQTGVGKLLNGEGLLSFKRSFMSAGASRLVTTLWPVDDRATAQLISYFYKNLLDKKLSPAKSLQLAQIEMLKKARWKNPYFWAGFVIHGDYREMNYGKS